MVSLYYRTMLKFRLIFIEFENKMYAAISTTPNNVFIAIYKIFSFGLSLTDETGQYTVHPQIL